MTPQERIRDMHETVIASNRDAIAQAVRCLRYLAMSLHDDVSLAAALILVAMSRCESCSSEELESLTGLTPEEIREHLAGLKRFELVVVDGDAGAGRTSQVRLSDRGIAVVSAWAALMRETS